MRRPLHLALLLLVAACARPGPEPAADPPAFETHDVTLANGWLLVHLEVPSAPAGPKPAVFVLGGKGAPLRDAGAIVVTFRQNWDALKALQAMKPPPAEPAPPPPKNTVGAWLLAAPTPKIVGQGYFQLISSQAYDVARVVDYLVTLPDVDPKRIGVMGVSTSGFTSLQAVAHDKRLSAAAVVAACGDYHRFLHGSSLGMRGEPLDLDRDYERWLRRQEPVHHAWRFTHAAVLMVNGTADNAIPRDCAEATARAFRRAYARAGVPERFRFVMLEGEGHNIGARAPYEVLAWWYRWFLRPG